MVYLTGDIHGRIDIGKLMAGRWSEGQSLTRDDLLIILGDFGLLWADPPDERDEEWLDWLEAQPWTTLWLDGNHENHDLIDRLPRDVWHGGRVHRLPGRPHIIHLMRGEVFDIEGESVFVMGGAESMDQSCRTPGVSWWPREMASDEECARAEANLEKRCWRIDYVLSHTCPASVVPSVLDWDYERWGEMRIDPLEEFLQGVDDRLDPARLKRWYFGHFHKDQIARDMLHVCLYEQIVPLGGLPAEDAARPADEG